MKKNEYPCNMIQDLIPLCAENLCSEESRAAVEAHIAECEECRKLAADLPVTKPVAVPDEKAVKPFRKVRRKMLFDRILLAVCAVLLCGLAYLTYGQIAKPEDGTQSFDTIAANVKMRRYAKMAAEGRFEELAPYLSLWELYQKTNYQCTEAEGIRAQAIEKLRAAYEEDIAGNSVQRIEMHSGYHSLTDRVAAVYTEAKISYKSGETMTLGFVTGEDGGIRIECTMYSDGVEKLGEAYRHTLNYEPRYSNDVFASLLTKGGMLEEGASRYESLKFRMAESVQERFMQNVVSFYKKSGYKVTNAEFSDVRFDAETKEPYWEVVLEAEDPAGTAVLFTRLTTDDKGQYVPQAAEQDKVYTDGCTPELAAALRGFFGGV